MTHWEDTVLIVGALGEIKVYCVKASERELNGEVKTVYHPELVTDLDFIDAHKKLHEVVTDAAGRFGHSIGEEHELQNERKERLVKDAAEVIEKAIQTLGAKRYVVSYPKAYVHMLEEKLSATAKSKIDKIVAADLVKTPADQLLDHFAS